MTAVISETLVQPQMVFVGCEALRRVTVESLITSSQQPSEVRLVLPIVQVRKVRLQEAHLFESHH